jgi:hypothetical protein
MTVPTALHVEFFAFDPSATLTAPGKPAAEADICPYQSARFSRYNAVS